MQTTSANEGFVYVVDPDDPTNMQERAIEIVASNGLTMAVKGSIAEGDEIMLVGDSGGASMGMGMGAAGSSASADVAVETVAG